MSYKILQGDNRDTLKTIPNNSIDAIVTDPPYGIDFLGKSWDANTGALETYQECLRVLKPGGHILAFSAARTYHHLAVTLEQAGFEIRDQIMWIYSSGFPKSQDVGRQLHKKQHGKPDKQRFDPAIMIKVDKDQYRHPTTDKIYRALPDINGDRLAVAHEGQKYGTVYEEVIKVDSEWSGWGTALKPAHEPIALARKPIKGNIRDNVQKWGTGAINIDAARIAIEGADTRSGGSNGHSRLTFGEGITSNEDSFVAYEANEGGRFPSNVLGDIPDYQKYFYCPKVSRKERHIGFDEVPNPLENYSQGDVKNHPLWDPSIGTNVQRLKHKILEHNKTLGQEHQVQGPVGNNHPTVKPVELMKYLIKLITPPGGTVLDPFNGSGSTGMAAVELGHSYIGCELDPAYVAIAEKRIAAWMNKDQVEPVANNFEALFQ
jgi:site-specific DNA-methyltransferase (adenine-specific)